MVYLITGGAGFVGSHLAERLLDRGDEVLLMDNLSTGSMENIRHLKRYDRMHYFLEPVENRQLLAELVDEADVIFHLAAAVGVKLIVESPVRTIETNVNGMQLVLEAACRKRKLFLPLPPPRCMGRTRRYLFMRTPTWCWGQRQKGVGAMPPQRRWMNSWRSLTGKKRDCRWWLPGYSIRSDLGKRVATGW